MRMWMNRERSWCWGGASWYEKARKLDVCYDWAKLYCSIVRNYDRSKFFSILSEFYVRSLGKQAGKSIMLKGSCGKLRSKKESLYQNGQIHRSENVLNIKRRKEHYGCILHRQWCRKMGAIHRRYFYGAGFGSLWKV